MLFYSTLCRVLLQSGTDQNKFYRTPLSSHTRLSPSPTYMIKTLVNASKDVERES